MSSSPGCSPEEIAALLQDLRAAQAAGVESGPILAELEKTPEQRRHESDRELARLAVARADLPTIQPLRAPPRPGVRLR